MSLIIPCSSSSVEKKRNEPFDNLTVSLQMTSANTKSTPSLFSIILRASVTSFSRIFVRSMRNPRLQFFLSLCTLVRQDQDVNLLIACSNVQSFLCCPAISYDFTLYKLYAVPVMICITRESYHLNP